MNAPDSASSPANPLVSILMPVWNVAPYVEAAVQSVLDQSWTAWELIVVDDHSNDGSDRLVEAFEDPRIRLLRQPRHCGIVAALNRAAGEARGEYLARMDGDDISHHDRLQRQLAFMRAHPSLDLIGTDCLVIDETDSIVARMHFPERHTQLQRVLRHRPCLHHGTWMLRKSAFAKLGGYRFDAAEDYDFLTRADTAKLRFGNLSEPLYSWRKHGGNTEVRKGTGLRQVKTHIYIQKLYRRRRRGLPEAHDALAFAHTLRSSPLMVWLHHAGFRVVRKGLQTFPKSTLRWTGYVIASLLSPYIAYRLLLGIRHRLSRTRIRTEPVVDHKPNRS